MRDVIWGQECCKQRCIFSKGKLTLAEWIYVQDIKDSCLFTCGSSLFPPTSELSSVVRQNCSCRLPVEVQYYSAKLISFPQSGLPEQSLVNNDEIVSLKQQYAVVRPICFFLQGRRKTSVHQSSIKHGKETKKITVFQLCVIRTS